MKKPRAPAPVHSGQTVSEAFGTILRYDFAYLAEWEDAARSWDDIEGVHQLRVTLRRMRAALSAFRAAVPRTILQSYLDEMCWLASQLGPARDLDVFIEEGLGAVKGRLPLPGQQKMAAQVLRMRSAAYHDVRAMLDSDRYARFKQSFWPWLDAEGWRQGNLKDKHQRRLEMNVVPFARKRLDKQERQVLAQGSDMDQDSPQALHRLRIACKRLRYLAEFFTPLFSEMDIYVGHLKRLQNLLGVMNDVALMQRRLKDLLAEQEDPELLQYAGGLVGWHARLYEEVKDSFDKRWVEFVKAEHPWWRKSTVIQ
jgi:Uncharacterized conserved protein